MNKGHRFIEDGMVCQVIEPLTEDHCFRCLHSISIDHQGTKTCLAIDGEGVCLCREPVFH